MYCCSAPDVIWAAMSLGSVHTYIYGCEHVVAVMCAGQLSLEWHNCKLKRQLRSSLCQNFTRSDVNHSTHTHIPTQFNSVHLNYSLKHDKRNIKNTDVTIYIPRAVYNFHPTCTARARPCTHSHTLFWWARREVDPGSHLSSKCNAPVCSQGIVSLRRVMTANQKSSGSLTGQDAVC